MGQAKLSIDRESFYVHFIMEQLAMSDYVTFFRSFQLPQNYISLTNLIGIFQSWRILVNVDAVLRVLAR